MFQLEGGDRTPDSQVGDSYPNHQTRGYYIKCKGFQECKYYQTKIENFFWHHARYYRHLVPKHKLKIYVLNVNNILHDAKKNFQFWSSSIYFDKIINIQCNTLWSSGQDSWLPPGSQEFDPTFKPKHFYFLIFFPGLSQNLTKNQS